MSLTFSDGSSRKMREACQAAGLTGDLSVSNIRTFLFETYSISDSYRLEQYKTISFSASKLGNRPFGAGAFHLAFKGVDADGNDWVVKKPIKHEHMKHIPTDFLKQHFAFKASEIFSDEVCLPVYGKKVFLRYLRPLIASAEVILKNGRRKKLDLFFEVESYIPGDFTRFNLPKGPTRALLDGGPLAPNRLPQVFSKWIYDATDKNALIVDVQGGKLKRGQYLCTDPIVFFDADFSFGLIDWHDDGMHNFLAEYKNLLRNNDHLRDLAEEPHFEPTDDQKQKMDILCKRMVRLANKKMPGNIAQMVQSKVRGRNKGRSRSF